MRTTLSKPTPSPVKRTVKAGNRAGKAIGLFEKAAADLDRASAEHLAVADELTERATADRKAAFAKYEADLEAAYEAYIDRAGNIARQHADSTNNSDALVTLAEINFDAAEKAQAQADNLRTLVTVA